MENTELEKLRKRLNDLEEKDKLERRIKELEKIPKIEVPNPQIPQFPMPMSQPLQQPREVPTTPDRPIYPSVSGELERGMQGINQGLQNMPHVMIPTGEGIKYTPQEAQRMNNIKKWALWILISLVVGYSVWRIGSIYLQ